MASRRNKKLLDSFKSKLKENGIDVSEYDTYFKEIENNLKDKKYGLVWENHTEEIEKELIKKFPILKEEKELRINKGEDYTNNFLIEGDNLESLTALKNMGKKVDVIEIDPPYGTGNKDFIYQDSFVDSEDSYRHSKWLSFMEKRMRLAKDLLKDDGIIFIHIDDNEVSNLKLMMDSVFGEENTISPFIWEKTYAPKNNNRYSSSNHEYIYVYFKDKRNLQSFIKLERTPENNKLYNKDDGDGRGLYTLDNLTAPKSKNKYNIEWGGKTYKIPEGGRGWSYSESTMYELIKDGRINLPDDERKRPTFKRYLKDVGGVVTKTILEYEVVGHTDSAKRRLDLMMGEKGVFDYPKPVQLIKYLLKLHPNKSATVLDFFAGSGTTGQAVLELNEDDGGNRNFILATNNENNICRDATYERNKKVIEGYESSKGKEVEGIPANLTYLKTGLKDKEDNLGEFGLDESLIEHAINNLKLIHNLSQETELLENVLYELEDNKTNTKYIIYNNFYIDEDELKKVNKSENNIIYVSEDNLKDSNLLEFDEVRSLNDLVVYK